MSKATATVLTFPMRKIRPLYDFASDIVRDWPKPNGKDLVLEHSLSWLNSFVACSVPYNCTPGMPRKVGAEFHQTASALVGMTLQEHVANTSPKDFLAHLKKELHRIAAAV